MRIVALGLCVLIAGCSWFVADDVSRMSSPTVERCNAENKWIATDGAIVGALLVLQVVLFATEPDNETTFEAGPLRFLATTLGSFGMGPAVGSMATGLDKRHDCLEWTAKSAAPGPAKVDQPLEQRPPAAEAATSPDRDRPAALGPIDRSKWEEVSTPYAPSVNRGFLESCILSRPEPVCLCILRELGKEVSEEDLLDGISVARASEIRARCLAPQVGPGSR